MWAALPHLLTALGPKEGWALLAFLDSPHGALYGLTPRQAIEQGQAERVLAVAVCQGRLLARRDEGSDSSGKIKALVDKAQ